MKNTKVTAAGIACKQIKEGDNIVKLVVDAVLNATYIDATYQFVENRGTKSGYETAKICNYDLNDSDIIGINDNIVSLATGTAVNKIYLDEIIESIQAKIYKATNKYVNVVMIHADEMSTGTVKVKDNKSLANYIALTFGKADNYTPITLIRNFI